MEYSWLLKITMFVVVVIIVWYVLSVPGKVVGEVKEHKQEEDKDVIFSIEGIRFIRKR